MFIPWPMCGRRPFVVGRAQAQAAFRMDEVGRAGFVDARTKAWLPTSPAAQAGTVLASR
jgi:hypothetical protein